MSQRIEQSILACLRKESPRDLSIEEIAAKTGIHRNTVSKYVLGLEKEGRVKIFKNCGESQNVCCCQEIVRVDLRRL